MAKVYELDPWQTIVKISGHSYSHISLKFAINTKAAYTQAGIVEPANNVVGGHTYGTTYYSSAGFFYRTLPPSDWNGYLDGSWSVIANGHVSDIPPSPGMSAVAPWVGAPSPTYAHTASDGGGGSDINVPGRVEVFDLVTSVDLAIAARAYTGATYGDAAVTPGSGPPYQQVSELLATLATIKTWEFDVSGLTVTQAGRNWTPIGIKAIAQPQDNFNQEQYAFDVWVLCEAEST